MKKGTGIIVFSNSEIPGKYHVRNFSIKTRQSFINFSDMFIATEPETMNSIIKKCLSIANNNGLYFDHFNEYGYTFHDIGWINIDHPGNIEKYGCTFEN